MSGDAIIRLLSDGPTDMVLTRREYFVFNGVGYGFLRSPMCGTLA